MSQRAIEELSRRAFDALEEYEALPPQAVPGMVWKRKIGQQWFLGEYLRSSNPRMLDVEWKVIQIRE